MLTHDVVDKIEKFVYEKPRSIQDIARHIGKNWRTADRYIDEIKHQYGTISTSVFREGTRGALKIVYWTSIEKASKNIFQQELENEILRARAKDGFSAFDIFQHVNNKDKYAWIKEGEDEVNAGRLYEFANILNQTKKQILFLSGNLSFINFKDKKTDIFKVLENLVKRGIKIKVLCRIDIIGLNNVEKLLSLNHKYGNDLIEIRHREHSIRATIIDDNLINLKEVKQPSERSKELLKKTYIFYTIKNKEWVEWLTKIFWKMFTSSVDAKKRIEEIESLKR
jgi:hypothetical protein